MNQRLGPAELHRRVERDRKSDEHRRRTDKAVQDGDQLRHRGHLNACGHGCADRAADSQHRQQRPRSCRRRDPASSRDRDGHPGDAEQVAAARRLLRRESAEAQDEQQPGDEIRDGDNSRGHRVPIAWNIRSIRCVTRKPPAMLIVDSRMAVAPSTTGADAVGPLNCSMPPTTMMPLMALVTLIERRVQRRRHVPDDLPPDDACQRKDGQMGQECGRRNVAEADECGRSDAARATAEADALPRRSGSSA